MPNTLNIVDSESRPASVAPPGFEGVEKKLEIDFHGFPEDHPGLRAIPKEKWDEILEHAKCTILNYKSNDDFTAYLLSESSLFVYRNKILLKTCGTTLCCLAAPEIIKAARNVYADAKVEFVQFSRSSFIFPGEQLHPHTSFSSEVAYLNGVFETKGLAYTLGAIDGPSNWHIYIADFTAADKPISMEQEQTLEVLMYELDPSAMAHFFKDPNHPDKKTAEQVTLESGIRGLIGEDAIIDDFLFDPCGYSMNALDGNTHYTIHITPEDGHSFVSFETNLPVKDNYLGYIQQIVNVFRPNRFSATIFADECADGSRADVFQHQTDMDGFLIKDHTFHKFAGTYKAVTCSYVSVKSEESAHPVLQRAAKLQSSASLTSPETPSCSSPMGSSCMTDKRRTFPSSSSSVSSSAGSSSPTRAYVSAFGGRSSSSGSQNGNDLGDEVDEDTLSMGSSSSPRSPSADLDIAPGFNVDIVPQDYKVGKYMREKIEQEDLDEAFFVINLGYIVQQYSEFRRLLPRVSPYYSVKCNPDPAVLAVLNRLGCGFDCSSKAEIDSVVALGADSVLFAPPCKIASQIKYARSRSVDLMTFDNEAELIKLSKTHPTARLLLRIAAPVPAEDNNNNNSSNTADGLCPSGFGMTAGTFGASLGECPSLLEKAQELGLDVVGVSCHVGTLSPDCQDPTIYVKALECCKTVFDLAQGMGKHMQIVDIGDGFPGTDILGCKVTFADIAEVLRPKMDQLFPPTVRIIAQPSRFLVSGAATLAVNVFARRRVGGVVDENGKEERSVMQYYVSDGIYGSFSCLQNKQAPPVIPIPLSTPAPDAPHEHATIFGPTCDGLDCITERALLPELQIGDWLYFPNMGADAFAGASRFNGFQTSTFFYVSARPADITA